jgi:hypothetical protein
MAISAITLFPGRSPGFFFGVSPVLPHGFWSSEVKPWPICESPSVLLTG